jgi:hypothetical protein
VDTFNRKYGVSNTLDIPSVRDGYKKSSIEQIIEQILKDRYGVEYISQYIIDAGKFSYSFDFFIPSCNLLIECQGDYFHDFKKNGYVGTPKDRAKSSYIENNTNYKLVCIWEHEIHVGRINKILDYHIYKILEPEINIPDLKKLSFRQISSIDAHMFLSQYHYLGNLGSSSKCYGAYYDDILVCVCTFGGTTRQGTVEKLNKFLSSKIHPRVIRELRRFCIRPNVIAKNLASYCLKRFIGEFCSENDDVKYMISFSDSTVCDVGTIYKASNWKKLPSTSNSYHYFDGKTNKSIHKKTVWNIANRAHMTEVEFSTSIGLEKVKELPKSVWLKIV